MHDFVKVFEVSMKLYEIIRAYDEKVKSQDLLQKAQVFGSKDEYELNKEYESKEIFFQNKFNTFVTKVLNGDYVFEE